MNTISDQITSDVKSLRDMVLQEILFDPSTRDAQLTFKHWDGSIRLVRLRGVLHLVVSGTLGHAGDSNVLHAQIQSIMDGGEEGLTRLGYLWRDSSSRIQTYPGVPLIGFVIEGDTCLEMIAGAIEVTTVGGAPLTRENS